MKQWAKTITLSLAISALAVPFVAPQQAMIVHAAEKASTPASIKLNGSATLTLRDAQYLVQDKGKVLSFTVLISNLGTKEMDLRDYLVRVKDKNGRSYPVSVSETDKSKIKLSGNSAVYITYYATLDLETQLSDLQFHFNVIDFSTAGYERPLGKLSVPKGTEIIPAGKSKILFYETTKLTTAVNSVSVIEDGENKTYTINLSVENTGYRSTNLGKAKFYLQSNNQKVYDVTTDDLSQIVLQPGQKKLLMAIANVPSSQKSDELSLVVAITHESGGIHMPLGIFDLPAETNNNFAFENENYKIHLKQVQRLSLGDQDTLVADLEVANNSKFTKAAPDFGGYFIANGVRLDPEKTSITVLGDQVLINPGESVHIIASTSVPYTAKINEVAFGITEKSQNSNRTLYQFASLPLSTIPERTVATPYVFEGVGEKAVVKINKTAFFEGQSNDFFYAEMEYQNQEKRSVMPNMLGGYIQNVDGHIIPVNFSKYDKKVFPGGKVLLSAWAKVPKAFAEEQFTLVVGQSVGEQTAAPAEADHTNTSALARTVAYNIALEDTITTEADYKEIPFMNYSLTLKNIYSSIGGSGTGGGVNIDGVRLNFKYDLTKLSEYEGIAEDHKLRIEFVDQDSKTAYTQDLTTDPNSKEAGIVILREGMDISKEIFFNDPNVSQTYARFQKYKLNIYDVFGDTQMLLASKEISWYVFEP